jgi:FkbM family methyltransferase
MPHALSRPEREKLLVREFFGDSKGFFSEVGANDPRQGSQSWHLEQAGWTGILIEPQPDLADLLRAVRSAKVFAVACSSPQNAGQKLTLHVAGPMSSLDRARMAPGALPEKSIEVPVRTLDDILAEAGAPAPLDFLSIDVEGHELEVLSGFDFARWRPRLFLIEDHVSDLTKHHYLRGVGYRLVRRTDNNGWYVPQDAPVSFGWRDRWEVWRKYYLALPFRLVRNFSRRLRQPFKDRRAARDHAGSVR